MSPVGFVGAVSLGPQRAAGLAGRESRCAPSTFVPQRREAARVRAPAHRSSASKVAMGSGESLGVGDVAPAFSVPADDGTTVSLDSFKGSKVVLYFYPRADTPGCTVEGCDFRDQMPNFKNVNAKVLGVSKDPVEDLKAFKDKYDFNFSLLSDKDATICEDYGVWQLRKLGDRELMAVNRSTFVIDEEGKIAKAWRGIKADGHVEQVLADLLASG